MSDGDFIIGEGVELKYSTLVKVVCEWNIQQ